MSQEIRVTPTLIIGLGGTGSLGIQFAKNSISQHLKPYAKEVTTDKIPFIECLSIDTTETETNIAPLSGSEFMYIGAITSREIRSMKADYMDALEWFPNRLSSTQINAGARGVRQLGRLCFFKYKSAIQKELEKKINQLKNLGALKSEVEKNFVNVSVDTEATRINIHLITSLGGGTGSAALLDVAFLLKYLLKDFSPMISAHLVGPEAFEADNGIGTRAKEYIKCNSAVALAELERFVDINQELSDKPQNSNNKKTPWSVQYIEDKITVSDKPLDFIYLLGDRAGGDKRKLEQICETIGLAITLKVVRPEWINLRGKFENIPAYVTNEFDALGRLTTYSSYNVGILTPELNEEAKAYLRQTIEESILESLLRKTDYEQVPNILKEFQKAAHDVENLITLDEEFYTKIFSWFKQSLNIDKGNLFTGTEDRAFKVQSKHNQAPKSFNLSFGKKNKQNINQSNKNGISKQKQINSIIKNAILQDIESQSESFKSELTRTKGKLNEWKEKVEISILNKAAKLLERGSSLKDLGAALNLYREGIKKAHLSFNENLKKALYQKGLNLESVTSLGDGWKVLVDNIIENGNLGKINDEASLALGVKLFSEIEPEIKNNLQELCDNFLTNIISACGVAYVYCLSRKENLSVNNTTSPATTNTSVIRLSEIDGIVQENLSSSIEMFIQNAAQKDKNVLEFIREKNKKEINKIIEQVFEGEYKRCLEKLDGIFTKSSKKPEFESVSESGIHELITLSSPLWNIEKVGQTIEPLSLVNISKDTQLGRWIASRLGAIFYDIPRLPNNENNVYANSLIIFQSEHGSCIAKFNILESCLQAVEHRLERDGKLHINELCLDHNWKIENPLTRTTILEHYKEFALAMIFGIIVFEGSRYYLLEKDNPQKPLGKDSGTDTMPRFKAFSFLITEKISLKSKVENRYHEEIKNARHLKAQVESYIQKLEKDTEELSETDKDFVKKSEQLQNEIIALTNLVLPAINEAIKNQSK
jgi:hypothetical protein